MTDEKLNEHVRKEVREQFKPRKPEPKQLVDPAGQKFFIGICQPREKEKLSDYDRSITVLSEEGYSSVHHSLARRTIPTIDTSTLSAFKRG
jgi:hypothetical protein